MKQDTLIKTAGDATSTFTGGQKVLDRYKLVRVLGQGGMGIVWLARDEELARDVALKFLPNILVNDRASMEDLKRETRRSLDLTHPNIVRTYDFVQDGAIAGISMEYVDSDTLRNKRIDQPNGVFDPATLGDWVRQLCAALDYAHQQAGIVHRDLKPANLMVNGKGQLKVADFGISRSLTESTTQLSGNSSTSGTLVYMSPQQMLGDEPTASDDVYAVGATLYELLTTRPPFYTGDIPGQISKKAVPSIRERRASLGVTGKEVPPQWEETIAACLSKDPAKRPRSAGEIAVRLGLVDAASITIPTTAASPVQRDIVRVDRLQAEVGSSSATSSPAIPSTTPVSEKPKPARALGLTILIATLLGGGFLVWRFGSQPTPPSGTKALELNPVRTEAAASTAVAASAVAEANPTPPAAADAPKPEATVVATSRPVAPPPSATQPIFGSVFIDSEPREAVVEVDSRPPEKTPIMSDKLTAGTHKLKINLAGYDPYEETFEVTDEKPISRPKTVLVQSKGWLNVETTDPATKILVKSHDKSQVIADATGSWKSEKIAVGTYDIVYSKDDWATPPKQIIVARGEVVNESFDSRAAGTVEFANPTPNVKVEEGKKFLGTTSSKLSFPPGKHTVMLKYPGNEFSDAPRQFVMLPGATISVDGALEKKPASGGGGAKGGSSGESSRKPRTQERSDGESGWDKARKGIDMFRMIRGY